MFHSNDVHYADTCQIIFGPDFTEPEFITTADVWYFLISEPQILGDGSILLPSSQLDSNQLHTYRGYGFGNPWGMRIGYGSYFEIAPVFRIDEENNPVYLEYFRHYEPEENKYKSFVFLACYSKLEFTEPFIKITSFPTNWLEDVVMNRNETLRVTLDLYNPTDIPVEADLVLMINIEIDETSHYYFVCPDPMFPSFQEEYCGISVKLTPEFYIQNPTIFELDLGTLPESFPTCRWYWFAALIDPVSGELISNISETCSDCGLW